MLLVHNKVIFRIYDGWVAIGLLSQSVRQYLSMLNFGQRMWGKHCIWSFHRNNLLFPQRILGQFWTWNWVKIPTDYLFPISSSKFFIFPDKSARGYTSHTLPRLSFSFLGPDRAQLTQFLSWPCMPDRPWVRAREWWQGCWNGCNFTHLYALRGLNDFHTDK